VAHEINNPLSFVVANLEVIADELSACAAPPVVQEALSDALEGARRIGAIVGRLRPLSRGEIDQRRQIDPRTVLDAALELAAHQLEGRARVERFYQEVPRVEADVGRLVQVVVNLLGNAADAFVEPGAAGNLIRVEALEAPGGKVALVVRDTGVGIAPEKLDRVFDPFFTTKPVGQGTGLGLTISRTLVRGLGGELSVESEPGRGSAFTVLLPAVQ
jgi:signal transduction histidine kinase